MQCVVYKSLKQFDYYLFVEKEDDLSRLPQGLRRLLGTLQRVVELELHEARGLAQADVKQVMQQLKERGYYLQMPSKAGSIPEA